jgi:hypothetical protein
MLYGRMCVLYLGTLCIVCTMYLGMYLMYLPMYVCLSAYPMYVCRGCQKVQQPSSMRILDRACQFSE